MNQSVLMMNLTELPNDFPHEPPEGYSYEATDFKKNVVAIWLRDHRIVCLHF